jgi:hypothetical protein
MDPGGLELYIRAGPILTLFQTIFTCPEPNIISQTIKSAKFGNVSFTKVFTEQGVTITVKHENSGASYTEQWARWVNEEGSYRYVCNEGGEAYMKATHEGKTTTPLQLDNNIGSNNLIYRTSYPEL